MSAARGLNSPQRHPSDFYETPLDFASACMRALQGEYPLFRPEYMLDAGCGTGHFGLAAKAVYPAAFVHGIDINAHPTFPVHTYGTLYHQDFLTFDGQRDGNPLYDCIFGNPPYSKAEEFVHHGLNILRPGGRLFFMLRTAFLASQRRWKTLYAQHPPVAVFQAVCRPSFTGDGKTDATEYCCILWRTASPGFNAQLAPRLHWFYQHRGEQA